MQTTCTDIPADVLAVTARARDATAYAHILDTFEGAQEHSWYDRKTGAKRSSVSFSLRGSDDRPVFFSVLAPADG